MDLGAWVSERYRVPGDPADGERGSDDDSDEGGSA